MPSGASTALAEAVELRDGDPRRYGGLGCKAASANVSGRISGAVTGRDLSQKNLDDLMVELDGTANKASLGANAILACSLAFALAAAEESGQPLFAYFAQMLGRPPEGLPRPTINLFSGGRHAGGQVPIQDVLIVPASPNTIDEVLVMTADVYRAASELVQDKYGERPLVADEGGFAPAFPTPTDMLDDAVEAINRAGWRPGVDVGLCVDIAASQFYQQGRYRLGAQPLEPDAMVETVLRWLELYPIVSLEDALAEDDWSHWPVLRHKVMARALVLGDDLLATNPQRIRRAIQEQAADALLLKVNQVGTLSEAMEALQLARDAGWMVTVSARSGDTEDSWLADLAVGWSADQLKVGSIARSERLAKWNRLLTIENATRLAVVNWPKRPDNG